MKNKTKGTTANLIQLRTSSDQTWNTCNIGKKFYHQPYLKVLKFITHHHIYYSCSIFQIHITSYYCYPSILQLPTLSFVIVSLKSKFTSPTLNNRTALLESQHFGTNPIESLRHFIQSKAWKVSSALNWPVEFVILTNIQFSE